jgi:hypothetical protein
MIEQQGLFKNHFVGRDGFYWWVGQIADSKVWKGNIPGKPVANNAANPGFGERYKVRIMGHHTAKPEELPDEQLPWATVMYPVTAGGGSKGSSQTSNLTQGTFVFGFFMDGEDAQQPVIMGAIGYNDYNYVSAQLLGNQPRFVPFTGFEKGKVSVYSVKENPGGQTPPVDGATGPSRSDAVTESVQSSNSTVDQASVEQKEAEKDPEPLAAPKKCQSAGGGLQQTLKNALKDIERTRKSVYKWQYNLSREAAELEAEIQKKIAKYTKKVMKWFKDILNNAQRDATAFLNRKQKQFHDLLFPSDREKLKKSVETANDLIACLFKKIFANLGQFIFDFLKGAVDKVINVANCVVDNLVGGILGQISSILDSIIKQAFGAFNAIIALPGEALGIAGAALDIIIRALSLLSCDEDPDCPQVNTWSIWGGEAGLSEIPADIGGLVSKITNFAGSVTDVVSIDNLQNALDIDVDGLFNLSACNSGPRACGAPTLQIAGGGFGAAVNLIVSEGGSVIGADVVNAGVSYLADALSGKVYDDCGKGSGAVVRLIPGTVIVGQTTTDPRGILPDGTETTGVIGVQIIEGGTGYLPSPDGSVGGDGRTWAENDETIVQHSNGNYEIPIPPGNQVCVVEGDLVTLPVGTTATTEPNSDSGGGELIIGGKAHVMKRAGCFTSPVANLEALQKAFPSPLPTDATGAYPAVLYLCHVDIQNSGINYKSTDKVIIEPSNGAEATFTLDDLGAVTSVKVTKGGEGFIELPEIYIESETGINAVLLPRLCIDRIGEDVDKPVTGGLVSVVDCVGKF